MSAILALVAEIVAMVPSAVQAGIDVANLVQKARDVLDANAAPSDADWQALDQQVNDLRAALNTDPPAS